jgi:imidazole glycerol-phosphate synthase subunit HisF
VTVRIIPRLDIKGPNLIKGIHLEGLRILGKPEDFARYYYENGADELIYMDAVASLYGRNSLLDIVERTSKEIFIPLTVGGGIRSVNDIRTVLRAGADKVSLNTAAIKNPQLITEASRAFGSSTIVVAIEAIRRPNGMYEAYADYGRERSGLDAIEWAVRVAELGAGEILLTSIDHEGTGDGYAIELTRKIAEAVSIPVIASGGAGTLDHIRRVIVDGKADAVCAASILHYEFIKHHEYDPSDFPDEGVTEFLMGKRGPRRFSKVEETTLVTIKRFLIEHGIDCRLQEAIATYE